MPESPHDTLIKALEKVEDMKSVIVIYEGKDGLGVGSLDSDLSVSDAVYLVEIFKCWLLRSVLGDSEAR